MSLVSESPDTVEVRQVDQEGINEFGRLNKRLNERRAELRQLALDLEKMDDAATELMLAEGGRVMLLVGEAFVEVSEEYANEYCEKKQEKIKETVEAYKKEESEILKRQEELKKQLYGRFGDSINLEN